MAGAEIPPSRHYRDFPQIENGVGMVRTFLREFKLATRKKQLEKRIGTVCTGKVFHPFLKDCVDSLEMGLQVLPIESSFWGPGIGVAGLLTGADFIAALKGRVLGDFVIIPSECMIGDDGLFLDDLKLVDLQRELGVPVYPSGYTPREFVGLLQSLPAAAAR
jgi:NifB/MoaA-like Fe-S oxidoreductase